MYSYRSSVVGSYIVMMIALAFNVMSMNLIIMDTPAGTATSIVVGWCIHYSYTRSVCVYHRFKTSHREENFLREEIEKDLPKPRGGWNMIDRQRMATKRLIKAFRGRNMHKKSIRAESFDGVSRKQDQTLITGQKILHCVPTSDVGPSISIEGYISLRSQVLNATHNTCRRYFVLYGCQLYFYYDRDAFQLDPSKPLSLRPLDISGFVVSGISVESPYIITLSPADYEDVREALEMVCDTIYEMRDWTKALMLESRSHTGLEWEWQVVE